MGRRIPVTPTRVPEPLRSEAVELLGEAAVVAYEAETDREIGLLLYGDPDAPEPVGLLRGGSPLEAVR